MHQWEFYLSRILEMASIFVVTYDTEQKKRLIKIDLDIEESYMQ